MTNEQLATKLGVTAAWVQLSAIRQETLVKRIRRMRSYVKAGLDLSK